MTRNHTLSLRATTALIGVLALGSTPAFAQSADPAASVQPQAVAPAAPTIVLPAPVSPTMQSTPVIQQTHSAAPVADDVPVAAKPKARVAPAKAAPARGVSPAAPAAAAIPAKAAPVAPVEAVAPPVAAIASAAPASTAPAQAASAPTPVGSKPETEWEIGLAVLAGIGLLGGVGMLAANARRRREVYDSEHAVYDEAAPAKAATAVEPAVEPAYLAESEPLRESMGIPDGSALTGEDREALLAEMIAAPPTAENPFRTRKARRRRANAILAQRDLDQQSAAAAPENPQFNWRKYEPQLNKVRHDTTLATVSA